MKKHPSDITNINSLPDRELISIALSGNQLAFSTLMQRHSAGLTIYINDYLSSLNIQNGENAEEPQDIVQEAFNKAFKSLSSYNEKYEFSTWIYNIAQNIAIDYIRKKKVYINNNNSLDISNSITNIGSGLKNSPEDKLISNQEYIKLVSIIESLDKKYQDPAKLRFINEYAYSEIAKILNLDINTVKTRIKRAKDLILKKKDT